MEKYSYEFWHQNTNGGYATLVALIVILVYHFFFRSRSFFFFLASCFRSSSSPSSSYSATAVSSSPADSRLRTSDVISDADLKFLIDNLEERLNENEKWEPVIDKRNGLLYYNARCCRPTLAPLKYLSVTVFENCTPEMLRDFYMDNDYRLQWDRTMVEHKQLQVDRSNGIEIGRTVKKFPLLTPREYILAWKLWEGRDKSYYCFIKECEHPMAPQQRKYVRVKYFRSGWRIRKVPGRNASEIKMFHQEDAGLNVEMAKLAFSKGIWSYVCKMDTALRRYSAVSHPQTGPSVSAVTFLQKVPAGLEATDSTSSPAVTAVTGSSEAKEKKLSRRPSRKLVANGLLLLGGVICLSRGHSALGAKVAMAFILSKLHKRGGASSTQSPQGLGK